MKALLRALWFVPPVPVMLPCVCLGFYLPVQLRMNTDDVVEPRYSGTLSYSASR
jgi:hypothetical protein